MPAWLEEIGKEIAKQSPILTVALLIMYAVWRHITNLHKETSAATLARHEKQIDGMVAAHDKHVASKDAEIERLIQDKNGEIRRLVKDKEVLQESLREASKSE